MIEVRRMILAGLTVLALTIGGATAAGAAGTHLGSNAKHSATKYGQLTINITQTSGTVWGSISVKPANKTCKKATCTFKIKLGTKQTLTETPTNSSTWPFSKWTLNHSDDGTGKSIHLKMGKHEAVGAVYVVPGGTLTVNITDTGTVWGTVSIPSVGVCSQSQCVYKNVPLGQKLTLTETPTDSNTWPFSGWTLNGSNAGTATTLSFNMAQNDTVDANYVLAG